ncbi:MAG: ABC transporter permease, partial [Symploca sp. SIO2C1]|nr:ABC transporter permease [Symploca sp. SIO2C1]
MTPHVLDRLGDWNPQLFRELKGRLKLRNVVITVSISLLGQFLLLLFFFSEMPLETDYSNWQRLLQEWWQNLFITSCCINICILLVAGSYMLISDLSQEERRATLDFIRLSPRSEVNILTGKLLGVPILLYLAAVLTVPLQLWAGLSAAIPLAKIFIFWVIVIVSCLFFYSAALLCSLVSGRLGGFLPWLGGGAVFLFLMLMLSWVKNWTPVSDPSVWLRLFSPFESIFYLFSGSQRYSSRWFNLHWYYLPIGASALSFLGFTLFNYGLWVYWIGQSLKRCFRNPNNTILNKGQSYVLVACLEVVILGFALQELTNTNWYDIKINLILLLILNSVVLLGLIALLSPQRQALQDWARYKKLQTRHNTSVQDWVWGEKSPAVVAMAINLAIAITPILLWIILQSFEQLNKTKIFFDLAFFASWILIYATMVQLMLMMKTPKREVWAAGAVGSLICLPPIILGVLGIFPNENPTMWLFSTLPWVGLEYGVTTTTVFIALIGEAIVLILLN